jgi:glycosyltransferase involved in cell wall biosynthesis
MSKPVSNDQPLVSIIIVTYNAGKYLKECLDSIINQPFIQFELIIKDGCSTDNTLEILEDYKNYINKIDSTADKGIYDAMNAAVKYAQGKWIYFLGADDRLLFSFSDFCIELNHTNTLYYGNCITANGVFGGSYSKYKLAKYSICQQAIFYPANVFNKYTYDTKYRVFADYALNLQCWGDSTIKKQYLNIDVAWYNLTGFSAVAADDVFKKDKPRLIKNSMGWLMYLRFLYKRRKEQKRPGSNFY